jgi:hypothetical protein
LEHISSAATAAAAPHTSCDAVRHPYIQRSRWTMEKVSSNNSDDYFG